MIIYKDHNLGEHGLIFVNITWVWLRTTHYKLLLYL